MVVSVPSAGQRATRNDFVLALNKVYGCVIQRKDHLINKETGKYDEEEYTKHPDRYTSTFKTHVSPSVEPHRHPPSSTRSLRMRR